MDIIKNCDFLYLGLKKSIDEKIKLRYKNEKKFDCLLKVIDIKLIYLLLMDINILWFYMLCSILLMIMIILLG